MPRTINPIKKLLVKNALMQGKSARQALKKGNYSEASIRHSTTNKVVKSCMGEIQQQLLIDNTEIIERLKRILKLKLKVEEDLYQEISDDKASSKKERMLLINKTKDNIAEITKTLRLCEGNSTEKIEIDDREARIKRLRERLLSQN